MDLSLPTPTGAPAVWRALAPVLACTALVACVHPSPPDPRNGANAAAPPVASPSDVPFDPTARIAAELAPVALSTTPVPRPAAGDPLPLLRLPASPPPGFTTGKLGYGASVARLDSPPRSGWEAADPHLHCEVMAGQLVMATWTFAGEAKDWPTELPERASCHNGPLAVEFRLGFGPGGLTAWPEASGRLIVPHNGVDVVEASWPVGAPLAAAAAVGAGPDFACAVGEDGALRVRVGSAAVAGPAACRLTLVDGSVREQAVFVLRYTEG